MVTRSAGSRTIVINLDPSAALATLARSEVAHAAEACRTIDAVHPNRNSAGTIGARRLESQAETMRLNGWVCLQPPIKAATDWTKGLKVVFYQRS